MPNAELNGDRRHDAYQEKLRRSVEAVQGYNAGLELAEQFSITGSLLRQLSGVKPSKVSGWIAENKTALETYDRQMGFAPRQNVGKVNPQNPKVARAAIKWNEQAYGEYEW